MSPDTPTLVPEVREPFESIELSNPETLPATQQRDRCFPLNSPSITLIASIIIIGGLVGQILYYCTDPDANTKRCWSRGTTLLGVTGGFLLLANVVACSLACVSLSRKRITSLSH